ncbi:non-ribosomal peptide synthetase [Breoghania sp.]|uniref:non-ribosomal peptide synthetase n=1 Tax=Breoghania sp. TaxID=2065378 RepID=UPI002AA6879A|nr:non-ribosomal peptide synthetase [Breoghania sp.]
MIAEDPELPIGAVETITVGLTRTQESLLHQTLRGTSNDAYLISVRAKVEGELDKDRFARAWAMVCQRHRILTAGFIWEGVPEPLQVLEPDAHVVPVFHDLATLPRAQADAEWQRIADEARTTPFDLETGPLVRVHVGHIADGQQDILAVFHHLIVDGWSLAILLDEVHEIYVGLASGYPLPNMHEAPEFSDFVNYETARKGDPGTFWAAYLDDLTPCTDLLCQAGHSAVQPASQPDWRQIDAAPGSGTASRLKAYLSGNAITVSTLANAAWTAVLACHGTEEAVYGVTMSGRPADLPGVEKSVGLFIKTLIARNKPEWSLPVTGWLKALQLDLARAREHDRVAMSDLISLAGAEPGNELFESILVVENYPVPARRDQDGALAITSFSIDERTHYPITLLISHADTLRVRLIYDRNRLPDEDADGLVARFLSVIGCFVDHPDKTVADALRRLPSIRNDPAGPLRSAATFAGADERIEALVRKRSSVSPQDAAVVFEDRCQSYADLAAASEAVSARLRRAGIGRGDIVGVLMERALDLPAVLLGVLGSGAAYLPLDPELPDSRLAFMTEDSGAVAVLAPEALADRVPPGVRKLVLEWPQADGPDQPKGKPAGTADDPAYVIYTSGSTGRPKGVVVPHRGVVNRILALQADHGLERQDRVLQKTPFGFDVSVWELFWPLVTGAGLVMARPGGHRDPAWLAAEIARTNVTVVHFVPSMLRGYAAVAPVSPGVRLVACSGEALAPDQPGAARAVFPNAQIHNFYGPTETSIEVTSWRCDPEAAGPVPIGHAIANVSLQVLDEAGRVLPDGAVGELVVGGPCVATGYLGRPGLTAERFVPDPTGGAGARAYRTGDRVRVGRGGALDYLGRDDDQVKVRGHRIEIGEVEAALAGVPGVRGAAAVVRQDGGGTARLIGYVAGGPGPKAVAECLARDLPAYMIPAPIIELDDIPLTNSGKTDRKKLPVPDPRGSSLDRGKDPGFDTSLDGMEELVAAAWAEMLGVEGIRPSDDFFDLGGHSLVATRVVSWLRNALQVDIALQRIFEHPVLSDFAAAIGSDIHAAKGVSLPQITPAPRGAKRQATPQEARLWFLHQISELSGTFNIPVVSVLKGAFDCDRLERALQRLTSWHEALRTRFFEQDGTVHAHLDDAATPDFCLKDCSGLDAAALQDEVAKFVAVPFDLSTGPLVRVGVFQTRPDEFVLAIVVHHIVCDGWSLSILSKDLSRLYAFLADTAGPIDPPDRITYGDFAAWLEQPDVRAYQEAQVDYWTKQLAGLNGELNLRRSRSREEIAPSQGHRLQVPVPRWMGREIVSFCREEGVTLNMMLLTLVGVVLSRHANQPEVGLGYPIAGRTRGETEQCVGLFLNTLVARINVAADPVFTDLLNIVSRQCLDGYLHQAAPFEQVVDALRIDRSLTETPLFQAMVIVQNAPSQPLVFDGVSIEPFRSTHATSKYDLTFEFTEQDGALACVVEYSSVFDEDYVNGLWTSVVALIEAVLADPERKVSEIFSLNSADIDQIESFNHASCEPAAVIRPVHETFSKVASDMPDRTALIFDGEVLTYADVEKRANQLAHALLAAGVSRGDVVGLSMPPCPDTVVGLLAVFKAGASFLPLDPSYPEDHRRYTLEDSGARVVIKSSCACPEGFALIDLETICLDEFPATPPGVPVGAEDGAYLLYTSGSTGAPKGVQGTHRAVANRVDWEVPGSAVDAVYALKTSINFIDSLWEIFAPLTRGQRVVIVPPDALKDAGAIGRAVEEHGVSRLVLVPSFLRLLMDQSDEQLNRLRSLEYIATSGETLPQRLADTVRERMPWLRLLNIYGTSEFWDASYADTFGGDRETDAKSIGRPLAGMRIYVLDPGMRLLPAGAPGELYVGGPGLAQAYVGQPGITADRFLPDAFSTLPGSRLYRTGDVGVLRPDGNLELVGRADRQVQIRGHRIELDGLEVHAARLKGVDQAAAVVRTRSAEDVRLVVYVTAEGGQRLDTEDLAVQLHNHLPPSVFPHVLQMEQFELTPSGKIQYKALPDPQEEQIAAELPRGGLETLIAEIWSDILGCESVHRQSNFFALGGHSLLVGRVVARLRQALGIDVSMRTLFDLQRLEAFSGHVGTLLASRADRPALPPLKPRGAGEKGRLSYAQARLFFLDRLGNVGAAYNVVSALEITGPLDAGRLELALGDVVDRHEALRMNFAAGSGEPVLLVAEQHDVRLKIRDLSSLQGEPLETEIENHIAALTNREFNLTTSRLYAFELISCTVNRHILVLNIHHACVDAWSMEVLLRDLGAFYGARAGSGSGPEPLAVQYSDFAVWQRGWLQGAVLEEQVAYWRSRLAGAPSHLPLPADHARPSVQDYRGGNVPVEIDAELSEAVRAFAAAQGVTVFMVLLGAFQVLLARWSGQWDVTVGTPIANRRDGQLEPLVGFFANTLALRAEMGGEQSFASHVDEVRARTLEAFAHQDLPFEKLVEELSPERDLSRHPVFQAMLAFQGRAQTAPSARLEGLKVRHRPSAFDFARFDLRLDLRQSDDRIVGNLEYAAALFEHATAERLVSAFHQLLADAIRDPSRALRELDVFPRNERSLVLHDFNDTAREYDGDETLDRMIGHQIAGTPSATAVQFGDAELSYTDLSQAADDIAHRLRLAGIGRGDIVAVLMERSLQLPSVLLGILRLGAAYLPLDPDHPVARLAEIVLDADVAIVVTTEKFEAKDIGGAHRLFVDRAERDPVADGAPPLVHPHKLDPAYVIYTSGSTGEPKGVVVPHGAIANRLRWMQDAYCLAAEDRVLQKTPLTFDVSVWELFWPLVTGARLVFAAPGVHRDPEALAQEIQRRQITVLHFVPTMLRHYTASAPVSESVRLAVFSGEALAGDQPAQARAVFPNAQLENLYGPTEAAVDVTSWTCDPETQDTVPIGAPQKNVAIHVTDAYGQAIPIGVIGKLHIAGIQLASGYLGRPGLTAERFLPDAFGAPGTRVYDTGDLAKWRCDGALEYVGRADHQVKIGGNRIELGEIEAALMRLESVSDACAITNKGPDGTLEITAFVVAEDRVEAPAQSGAGELVDRWTTIYDTIYGRVAEDGKRDFVGWNSSFTGTALSQGEMTGWLDATVKAIAPEPHERVLEVGVGTGLLLFEIAPRVAGYVGTDISAVGLRGIRSELRGESYAEQVVLYQREATQLDGVVPEPVDLVILNSVVQYFPSVDYLLEALDAAVDAVRDGGRIFIGDVQNHDLTLAFHAAVLQARGDESLDAARLLQVAEQRAQEDQELRLSPSFFAAIRSRLPRVGRVTMTLKTFGHDNELSRYRYDVTLHVGKNENAGVTEVQGAGLAEAGEIVSRARTSGLPCKMVGLVNARVSGDLRRLTALKAGRSAQETGGPITAHGEGFDPDRLVHASMAAGVPVRIVASQDPERFDAIFGHIETDDCPARDGVRLELTASMPQRAARIEALAAQIRADLARYLPAPMIPSQIRRIAAIPYTGSGKADRKALSELSADGRRSNLQVPPRTPLEADIVSVWQAVLGIQRVSIDDNFFTLGGDSLKSLSVLSELKKRGWTCSLETLFQHQTPAELASAMAQLDDKVTAEPAAFALLSSEDRPVLPDGLEDAYPLSSLQLGMFYHTEFDQRSSIYLDVFSYRIRRAWNAQAMRRALESVAGRHPVLRTSFHLGGFSEPLQFVHGAFRPSLTVHDLRGLAADERARRIADFVEEEKFAPFEAEMPGLWRVNVHRESDEDFLFSLSFHHAILDGWSVATLLTELAQSYVALCNGQDADLGEIPAGYSLHVATEREALKAQDSNEFWRRYLEDLPATKLPFRSEGGAGAGSRLYPVPDSLHRRLSELAREQGVPLRSLLLAAHLKALSKLTGQRKVVTGVVTSNRPEHPSGGRMVGLFLNLLPIRAEITPASWREFAQSQFENERNALRHRHVPLARIQGARGSESLFDVFFNFVQFHVYQDLPFDDFDARSANFQEETNYALEVQFSRDPDGRSLVLRLNFDGRLLPEDVVESIAARLIELLGHLAAHPDAPMSAVDEPKFNASDNGLNDTFVDFDALLVETDT